MTTHHDDALDAWTEAYKPVQHPTPDLVGWNGCMFETYGPDWDRVARTPVHHVWTWCDVDEGTALVAGRAYVNRIGYLITQHPWTDPDTVVPVETYGPDDDDAGDVIRPTWCPTCQTTHAQPIGGPQ